MAGRQLSSLEAEVLQAALILAARGQLEFHGYELAMYLEDARGEYRRTGFSSLYRALDRLDSRNLLASRWDLSGPRPRRLYQVNGEAAVAALQTILRPRVGPRLVIA